jgi:hypothetical protein
MRLLRLPPLLTPTGWRMRRAARDVRRLVENVARARYEAHERGRPTRAMTSSACSSPRAIPRRARNSASTNWSIT